jgi:hypothetical protein
VIKAPNVSRVTRLFSAAPALAAFLVYCSTLGAGFVYDDEVLIRTNPGVQDAGALWRLPARPLLPAAGPGDTNYYRPLVNVLDNLAWQAGGGRPFAFHLLNVLLHVASATLVMLLVRRLRDRPDFDPVALGAGVLFAVHPLCTEAVAWASGLPELGYVTFGLATMILHVSSRRLAAWVCFGLALACKETAVVVVPLIALMEAWKRGPVLRRIVRYLVVVVLFFLARVAVLGGLMPHGTAGLRTASDVVLNAPMLLLLYLKMMIVPWPLTIEHVVKLVGSASDLRFSIGLAGIVVLGIAVGRLSRSRSDLAFAACWSIVPLLPALYLPALGRDPFAERYAYFAVAGFCWLLAGGAEALLGATRWALPAFLYLVVIASCVTTIRRCGDWDDDGTLGASSIRHEPRAAVGYLLRGTWLLREGRKEDAYRVFRDGVDHAPASVELHQYAFGLGAELGHLKHDDLLAEYERLVPLARDSAPAEFNLGHALLEGGRLDAAEAAFTRALELAPDSIPTMTGLARIAVRRGDAATLEALCRRAESVKGATGPALVEMRTVCKTSPP